MTAADDEECTHTGMLKSGCYHCTIQAGSINRPKRELIPDSEVLARFPARFDKQGGCEYCGGDTDEGEPLCLTESYGYVHEEHCEPKPDTWPEEHLSLR